jgi:F-type H+-transporting ATPase subunit epsilon
MQLLDATQGEVIDGVTSFVGEDGSGSFGIQAGHARIMTSLSFGLARFRKEAGAWQYLALPGALLYFEGEVLTLSTRHYVIDDDYQRISDVLQDKLLAEEEELKTLKESMHRMEEEALHRMWRLGKMGARRE